MGSFWGGQIQFCLWKMRLKKTNQYNTLTVKNKYIDYFLLQELNFWNPSTLWKVFFCIVDQLVCKVGSKHLNYFWYGLFFHNCCSFQKIQAFSLFDCSWETSGTGTCKTECSWQCWEKLKFHTEMIAGLLVELSSS